MNCQDIASILDDGDLRALDREVRQSASTHLAQCPSCARVWSPLVNLAAITMPAIPDDMAERCASLVAAEASSGRRRAARIRPLVLGAALAFAAAAAMLTSRLIIPEPARQPAASQDLPVVDVQPAKKVTPAASGIANAPAEPRAAGDDNAPAGGSPLYELRMLPLSNEASDAASAQAVEAFHAALVEQLRALPRINVVTVTESPGHGNAATGSTIKIHGTSAAGSGRYQVSMTVDERTIPSLEGRTAARAAFSMMGEIMPACRIDAPTGEPQCKGPEALAADAVSFLRTRILPPDESLRQSTIATLRDPTLSAARRFQALREVASMRPAIAAPGRAATSPAAGLQDPAVTAGAIELAAATADAEQRASIWRSLRQVSAPELLQPLVDVSRLDPVAEVRAEAVAALASNFASDARARAALEAVAREDSHNLVKALARRGLSGDETWNAYVVQSLADRGRPPAERLEPLLFHVRQPSAPGSYSMAGWNVIGSVLDDASTLALVEVLPEAYAQAVPQRRSMLSSLVSMLAYSSPHPAVTQMVLDNLEGAEDKSAWLMAADGLMRRPDHQDPRVRSVLEKMAATPSDEQARQSAQRLLQRVPPVGPEQPSAQ